MYCFSSHTLRLRLYCLFSVLSPLLKGRKFRLADLKGRPEDREIVDKYVSTFQEGFFNLPTDTRERLPLTDDASAQFMNMFSSVLIRYTDRDAFATVPWRGPAAGSIRASHRTVPVRYAGLWRGVSRVL